MQGYQPQLQNMDNETSKDVGNFIAEHQAKVHYTPADIHRTNIAKVMLLHAEEPFQSCGGRRTPLFLYGNLV